MKNHEYYCVSAGQRWWCFRRVEVFREKISDVITVYFLWINAMQGAFFMFFCSIFCSTYLYSSMFDHTTFIFRHDSEMSEQRAIAETKNEMVFLLTPYLPSVLLYPGGHRIRILFGGHRMKILIGEHPMKFLVGRHPMKILVGGKLRLTTQKEARTAQRFLACYCTTGC